jgi:hypothetical protein
MITNILLTYFLVTFSLLVIVVMLRFIDEESRGLNITLGSLLLLSPFVLAGCGIYVLWS